ncbi:hypothetical protein HDU76_003338 [Blyttiomyces sp. JEL0837]|nr:hypothetical protein HDU76_003338 [Blyttiomyces sp. JEL0837]
MYMKSPLARWSNRCTIVDDSVTSGQLATEQLPSSLPMSQPDRDALAVRIGALTAQNPSLQLKLQEIENGLLISIKDTRRIFKVSINMIKGSRNLAGPVLKTLDERDYEATRDILVDGIEADFELQSIGKDPRCHLEGIYSASRSFKVRNLTTHWRETLANLLEQLASAERKVLKEGRKWKSLFDGLLGEMEAVCDGAESVMERVDKVASDLDSNGGEPNQLRKVSRELNMLEREIRKQDNDIKDLEDKIRRESNVARAGGKSSSIDHENIHTHIVLLKGLIQEATRSCKRQLLLVE